MSDTYLTPPEVARQLRVKVDKVYSFIAHGELRAVDLATRRGGRPRWKISPQALAEFLQSRESGPVVPRQRRRRFQEEKPAGWVEYYPE